MTTLFLTLLSPVLWYVDKVHTEFFTFTLTLCAVILFVSEKYIPAALFLALVTTQNISFGAIAAIPIIVNAICRKDWHYRPTEVAMLVAVCLLVLVHPAYYFFRHGVITPQLLAGGAQIGANLAIAPIWFFDPDVGLFSNWPLGVGLLLLAILAKRKGVPCAERRGYWFAFVVVYLAISLVAQSSTDNLNSGASSSIARYATWYLALFFPVILMTLNWLTRAGAAYRFLGLLIALAGATYNTLHYYPSEREGWSTPSPISGWIQTHWPSLYNPPAEIFAERNSGIGESPALGQALAVVGPDCRKMLMFNIEGRTSIFGGFNCGLDYALLSEVVRKRIRDTDVRPGLVYDRLTDTEAEFARFRCPSKIDFGKGGNLTFSIATGFYGPEAGGRWSDRPRARLICWLGDPGPNRFTSLVMTTSGFVINKRRQRMLASINKMAATEISYDVDWGKKTVTMNIPPSVAGELELEFEFPDAISPRALMGANDPRELGVWFESIEFKR